MKDKGAEAAGAAKAAVVSFPAAAEAGVEGVAPKENPDPAAAAVTGAFSLAASVFSEESAGVVVAVVVAVAPKLIPEPPAFLTVSVSVSAALAAVVAGEVAPKPKPPVAVRGAEEEAGLAFSCSLSLSLSAIWSEVSEWVNR
jgi:hypothetical protein